MTGAAGRFIIRVMRPYLRLLEEILARGVRKEDRTGTGTLSLFGWQSRYDLSAGFPLLTTKKIHFKSVVHELLWFLKGDTNVAYLKDNGVSIWDEWADEHGDVGPLYGAQWRGWRAADGGRVDQMRGVVEAIRRDPDSRRLLVSAWNPGELGRMRLAPCHVLIQFYVAGNRLSCQFYQRSADVFLGVPFNVASYALLTAMVAHVCELARGELIHSIGDAHLYRNHLDQAREQLTREPLPPPRVRLNAAVTDLFDFRFEDVTLLDYNAHPHIAAPVAV